AWAHPRSAHRTSAAGCSCSPARLPTPRARDHKGADAGRGDLNRAVELLKTPTANLGRHGGGQHPAKRRAGGHGPTLADELEHLVPATGCPGARLLPTPLASDATKGGPNQRRGSKGDPALPTAAVRMVPCAAPCPARTPTAPGAPTPPRS